MAQGKYIVCNKFIHRRQCDTHLVFLLILFTHLVLGDEMVPSANRHRRALKEEQDEGKETIVFNSTAGAPKVAVASRLRWPVPLIGSWQHQRGHQHHSSTPQRNKTQLPNGLVDWPAAAGAQRLLARANKGQVKPRRSLTTTNDSYMLSTGGLLLEDSAVGQMLGAEDEDLIGGNPMGGIAELPSSSEVDLAELMFGLPQQAAASDLYLHQQALELWSQEQANNNSSLRESTSGSTGAQANETTSDAPVRGGQHPQSSTPFLEYEQRIANDNHNGGGDDVERLVRSQVDLAASEWPTIETTLANPNHQQYHNEFNENLQNLALLNLTATPFPPDTKGQAAIEETTTSSQSPYQDNDSNDNRFHLHQNAATSSRTTIFKFYPNHNYDDQLPPNASNPIHLLESPLESTPSLAEMRTPAINGVGKLPIVSSTTQPPDPMSTSPDGSNKYGSFLHGSTATSPQHVANNWPAAGEGHHHQASAKVANRQQEEQIRYMNRLRGPISGGASRASLSSSSSSSPPLPSTSNKSQHVHSTTMSPVIMRAFQRLDRLRGGGAHLAPWPAPSSEAAVDSGVGIKGENRREKPHDHRKEAATATSERRLVERLSSGVGTSMHNLFSNLPASEHANLYSRAGKISAQGFIDVPLSGGGSSGPLSVIDEHLGEPVQSTTSTSAALVAARGQEELKFGLHHKLKQSLGQGYSPGQSLSRGSLSLKGPLRLPTSGHQLSSSDPRHTNVGSSSSNEDENDDTLSQLQFVTTKQFSSSSSPQAPAAGPSTPQPPLSNSKSNLNGSLAARLNANRFRSRQNISGSSISSHRPPSAPAPTSSTGHTLSTHTTQSTEPLTVELHHASRSSPSGRNPTTAAPATATTTRLATAELLAKVQSNGEPSILQAPVARSTTTTTVTTTAVPNMAPALYAAALRRANSTTRGLVQALAAAHSRRLPSAAAHHHHLHSHIHSIKPAFISLPMPTIHQAAKFHPSAPTGYEAGLLAAAATAAAAAAAATASAAHQHSHAPPPPSPPTQFVAAVSRQPMVTHPIDLQRVPRPPRGMSASSSTLLSQRKLYQPVGAPPPAPANTIPIGGTLASLRAANHNLYHHHNHHYHPHSRPMRIGAQGGGVAKQAIAASEWPEQQGAGTLPASSTTTYQSSSILAHLIESANKALKQVAGSTVSLLTSPLQTAGSNQAIPIHSAPLPITNGQAATESVGSRRPHIGSPDQQQQRHQPNQRYTNQRGGVASSSGGDLSTFYQISGSSSRQQPPLQSVANPLEPLTMDAHEAPLEPLGLYQAPIDGGTPMDAYIATLLSSVQPMDEYLGSSEHRFPEETLLTTYAVQPSAGVTGTRALQQPLNTPPLSGGNQPGWRRPTNSNVDGPSIDSQSMAAGSAAFNSANESDDGVMFASFGGNHNLLYPFITPAHWRENHHQTTAANLHQQQPPGPHSAPAEDQGTRDSLESLLAFVSGSQAAGTSKHSTFAGTDSNNSDGGTSAAAAVTTTTTKSNAVSSLPNNKPATKHNEQPIPYALTHYVDGDHQVGGSGAFKLNQQQAQGQQQQQQQQEKSTSGAGGGQLQLAALGQSSNQAMPLYDMFDEKSPPSSKFALPQGVDFFTADDAADSFRPIGQPQYYYKLTTTTSNNNGDNIGTNHSLFYRHPRGHATADSNEVRAPNKLHSTRSTRGSHSLDGANRANAHHPQQMSAPPPPQTPGLSGASGDYYSGAAAAAAAAVSSHLQPPELVAAQFLPAQHHHLYHPSDLLHHALLHAGSSLRPHIVAASELANYRKQQLIDHHYLAHHHYPYHSAVAAAAASSPSGGSLSGHTVSHQPTDMATSESAARLAAAAVAAPARASLLIHFWPLALALLPIMIIVAIVAQLIMAAPLVMFAMTTLAVSRFAATLSPLGIRELEGPSRAAAATGDGGGARAATAGDKLVERDSREPGDRDSWPSQDFLAMVRSTTVQPPIGGQLNVKRSTRKSRRRRRRRRWAATRLGHYNHWSDQLAAAKASEDHFLASLGLKLD